MIKYFYKYSCNMKIYPNFSEILEFNPPDFLFKKIKLVKVTFFC